MSTKIFEVVESRYMLRYFYRKSFRDIPIVTIHVGKSRAAFHVHMNHVCRVSPVLKSAFTGKFKETAEKSMDLPENDPDVFELFLQWVYEKTCQLPAGDINEEIDKRYMQLAQLYVLADQLLVIELKNYVIDLYFEITTQTDRLPRPAVVFYVYENSMKGSPLRKLLVQSYSCMLDLGWYKNKSNAEILSENPEFASDLAITFASQIRSNDQLRSERGLGDKKSYYEASRYVLSHSNYHRIKGNLDHIPSTPLNTITHQSTVL